MLKLLVLLMFQLLQRAINAPMVEEECAGEAPLVSCTLPPVDYAFRAWAENTCRHRGLAEAERQQHARRQLATSFRAWSAVVRELSLTPGPGREAALWMQRRLVACAKAQAFRLWYERTAQGLDRLRAMRRCLRGIDNRRRSRQLREWSAIAREQVKARRVAVCRLMRRFLARAWLAWVNCVRGGMAKGKARPGPEAAEWVAGAEGGGVQGHGAAEDAAALRTVEPLGRTGDAIPILRDTVQGFMNRRLKIHQGAMAERKALLGQLDSLRRENARLEAKVRSGVNETERLHQLIQAEREPGSRRPVPSSGRLGDCDGACSHSQHRWPP